MIHSLIEREKNIHEALTLAQQVAGAVQNEAHQQIASIVTRCLAVVFCENPYTFKIRFELKRGRTEAVMLFGRNVNGRELEVDPMTSTGGGPVDVACFALRLACLMLSRPSKRLVIVADEPFKMLSVEYRGRVRDMLMVLSREMGVQMILISHMSELVDGKDDGRTIIQLA